MDESMRDLLTRTLRARLGFSEDSLAALASAEIERLRAELDAELAKPKADPDIDRIKREREVAHTALNQIHTAFGDPRCGPFNPANIADRVVKVIKEWREKRVEAICPLCRGDGRRFYDATTGTTRFCSNCGGKGSAGEKPPEPPKCAACGGTGDTYYGHPMACRECESHKQPQPEPPKKAVYEWQFGGWNNFATRVLRTFTMLRCDVMVGRVTERTDGFYDWSANVTPSATDGERASLDLAKAAVEAVVRAHFGDEA